MTYVASLLERYQPGTIKVFGGPRPKKEANTKEAEMSGAESKTNGVAPAGIGHNSDARVPTAEEVQAEIDSWMAATAPRCVEMANHRKGAKGSDRRGGHRKAELLGLMRYYRANPRADAAPGVLSVIVMTSDNDEHGASSLSIARIARLLARSVESITDAIHRLVSAGSIAVLDRYPSTPLRWPLIPRVLAVRTVSLFDIINIAAPAPRVGRAPQKPLPPSTPGGLSNPSPLNPPGVTPETPPPLNPGGIETPPPLNPKPLPLQPPPEATNEATNKKRGADAPPAAKGPSAQKGTRLAEHWVLPEGWRAHPRGRGLSEPQIDAVAKKFHSYWTTLAGQKAVRLNWSRVWTNWVDNQIDTYGLKPAGKPSSTAQSDIDAEVQRRLDADIGRLMIGTIGLNKARDELRKQVMRERGGANG